MIDTLGAVKRKKTQNTSFLCMIVLPMMLLEVWKKDEVLEEVWMMWICVLCYLSLDRHPKYQSKSFWKLTFLLYISLFLCMIILPMMLLEVWKRDSLGGVIVWSGKVLKDGSPVFQSNTFSGDRLFYHSYQRQKGQIKWKRNRKIDHSLFCHQWSLLDWTNFGSWGSWRGPFLTMRWAVLN